MDAVLDPRTPVAGLASVQGPARPPLRNDTVTETLARGAREWPEREFAVFSETGRRWTYRGFAAAVDRLATGLIELGLCPGDRIGIWSPNRPEWLLVQFASARAGLILVTVNPAYQADELRHALNLVGMRALVLAGRHGDSDFIGILRALAPELGDRQGACPRAAALPDLEFVIHMGEEPEAGMVRFADVAAARPDGRGLERVASRQSPTDAINIQFTSGTTGRPKGATLSHHNIVNNARQTAAVMDLGPNDRICAPVPLYHCFGMVMGSLAAATVGSCVVFPGERFNAIAALDAVERERCTALYGVPTMYVAMLDEPSLPVRDLTRLRTGIMAGAPCPAELMRRLIDELHMPEVTICFGMTETSPVTFQTARSDPPDRRVGTIGRVHPHVEAKVVDGEGRTLACGTVGEVLIRGYVVMKGYWDDPAATAAAIDGDGWMHTGDLGSIDAEGYGQIVGRASDMVIRGGENIYPREIEEFLHRHEGVRDVQVFGVPDPKYGEEVCAWIVPHDGCVLDGAMLRTFCEGAIARYKIPRIWRFVDSFPLTVTGKARKLVMRRTMERELAGAVSSGSGRGHRE